MTTTTEAWYLYAYNGSGLPMHARVEVEAADDTHAVVRFVNEAPPLDELTETAIWFGRRRVNASRIVNHPTDSNPASFNWLD